MPITAVNLDPQRDNHHTEDSQMAWPRGVGYLDERITWGSRIIDKLFFHALTLDT